MVDSASYDTVYFGNPIMDITCNDSERAMLTKYGMELGMVSLATPEQMPMFKEMFEREDRLISAGGAALNSARGHKFVAGENKVAYIGCIGQDEFGSSLAQKVSEAGVHAEFHTTSEEPTGTAAVVVVDKERTIVANIAAAKKYELSHLESKLSVLSNAKNFYTTGFFVDSNFEAVKRVCDFALHHNKPFAFNLSATFVIQFYATQIEHVFKYADFVFGNQDESACFAQANGLKEDERVEAAKLLAKKEKLTTGRPRVVIFTMGADPTIVVTCHAGQEPTVEHVPVDAIPKESIVDTNGAGDSFVGAFMESISRGKTVVEAVQAGNTLAGKIVQKSGVIFE